MSVYRASVPRTLVLVVALFSTGAATGAFAREFRAADTTCEDHPTIQALHRLARVSDVAPIGKFVLSMNVLAMAFLFRSIEHPQKVLDRPTVKARLVADRTQWQRGVTRS